MEILRGCWHSPVRGQLPALFLLQLAGQLALALSEAGDLDSMRRQSAEVGDAAAAAEAAWGQGAAAAVAGLRLGEARALMATDPAAAVPALDRAVQLAEDWGRTVVIVIVIVIVIALASLARAVGPGRAVSRPPQPGAGAGGGRDRRRASRDPAAARPAGGADRAGLDRARRGDGHLYEPLTDRELSILRALRGTLSARDIGAEMHLSINTVKGYTKSPYREWVS